MRAPSLILLFLLLVSSISRADDGFLIKNYHVEVLLQEDGVVKVIEDIQVDFKERRRGIFRSIPTLYDANGDKKYRVQIDDIKVSTWNYKVSKKGYC